MNRRGHRDVWTGIGVFVAVLAGYWATVLPGPGGTPDSSKFQFLAHVLGIPHPTGYPLYLILSHAFDAVCPIGSVAFRANLLSAVFAALTAATVFRAGRSLGSSIPVACASAGACAFAPTLWSQAVIAEVYTLHTWLFAWSVSWFIRWQCTGRAAWFVAAWAVWLVSFGNHALAITLLPAIAVFAGATARPLLRRPHIWLALCAIAVVAAAQYAYPFWRTADPTTAYVEAPVRTIGDLVDYITGARYRDNYAGSPIAGTVAERAGPIATQILRDALVLLPAALVGLAVVARAAAALLALAALASLAFTLTYPVADHAVYLVQFHVALAILAAPGLERVLDAVRLPALGRVAFAVALPVAFFVWNRAEANANTPFNTAYEALARRIVATVERDAIVLTESQTAANTLFYLLHVERAGRPDVDVTIHFHTPLVHGYLRRQAAIGLPEQRRRIAPGRRVYCLEPTIADRLRRSGLDVRPVADAAVPLHRVTVPRTRPAGS